MTNAIRKRLSRLVSGHLSIGPVTIYGANAMHFAVNIKTPLGYVCMRPPQRHWSAYLYISPNATPWAAWFIVGRDESSEDKRKAKIRRDLACAWLTTLEADAMETIERFSERPSETRYDSDARREARR